MQRTGSLSPVRLDLTFAQTGDFTAQPSLAATYTATSSFLTLSAQPTSVTLTARTSEMRRRVPPSLAIVLLCAAGCPAPALENFTVGEPSDPSGGTSATDSTTLAPAPTTGAGPALTTTTDYPGTTTIGGDSTGALSSTTPDPLAPPAIVEHTLAPDPLKYPGAITVTIATEHADGVRMQVDGGAPVELAKTGDDAFLGEIAFYTALANDDHEATFVAWRDALASPQLAVPFTVALPKAGSELFWDADPSLGQGVIVALAVTPAHELIELGTYYPMGQPRCYLRRRDLGGAWGPDDVIEVLPDTMCLAIDLAVDATGALHVLANRPFDNNNNLRWWLGKISAWGEPPTNIGTGAPDDTAHALALDSEQLAVCGTRAKQTDLDAVAWIFTPNQPGKVLSFDYEPPIQVPTPFSETPRDCVFADDTLALAGEVLGLHGEDNFNRERHFVLEVDMVTDEYTWHVAAPGPGTQSSAQAIAVDGDGRYITAGYSCGDACQPHAELRMLLPGGAQIWQKSLDPAIKSPRAIAWTPAEYIAHVASFDEGQGKASFFAQAWFPLHGQPLWSYSHTDGPALHAANTLAIGPYGQIYAGGVTAGGYPALAIIAP